jgi:hypothetical protein
MKLSLLLTFVCLFARGASAGPLFGDPFGAGAPDVLGDANLSDIRSLEIDALTVGELRITVRMRWGGEPTLAPFTGTVGSLAGLTLAAGDVLIEGSQYLWAIPLAGPSGAPGGGYFTAAAEPTAESSPRPVFPGGLYRVPGFLSAGQVLGLEPSDDLRAGAPVWGITGSDLPEGFGYVTTSVVEGSELEVQIFTTASAAFVDDVANGFHLRFASTTCACDVIDATVPESAPAALLLAACAAGAYRMGAWRASCLGRIGWRSAARSSHARRS